MVESVLCLRILMEHGHVFQLPMDASDARFLIEKWERMKPDEFLTGNGFSEDGRPWQWSLRAGSIMGIQTIWAQQQVQQHFNPNQLQAQQGFSHHPRLGRS